MREVIQRTVILFVLIFASTVSNAAENTKMRQWPEGQVRYESLYRLNLAQMTALTEQGTHELEYRICHASTRQHSESGSRCLSNDRDFIPFIRIPLSDADLLAIQRFAGPDAVPFSFSRQTITDDSIQTVGMLASTSSTGSKTLIIQTGITWKNQVGLNGLLKNFSGRIIERIYPLAVSQGATRDVEGRFAKIAFLGTSITKGLFSAIPRGSRITAEQKDSLFEAFRQAGGDFAELLRQLDERFSSQSASYSGFSRNSLIQLLGRNEYGKKVIMSENFAASGARVVPNGVSPSLSEQVTEYMRRIRRDKVSVADVIILEMGSNDLLVGVSSGDFRRELNSSLEELNYFHREMKQNPLIVIIGIPNIRDIFLRVPLSETAFSYSDQNGELLTQTCFIRYFIVGNIPPSQTALNVFNTVLKDAVIENNFSRNKNYAFVDLVKGMPQISRDFVAADCFHPSALAHNYIAQAVFQGIRIARRNGL